MVAKQTRVCFFFLVLIFAFSSSAVYAEESVVGNYLGNAGTKLGRGIKNVLTSPAELPCTVHAEAKYGLGAWTGIGKGTLSMFKRFMVGASEVMTFMVPKEKKALPEACSEALRKPYSGV